MPSLFHSAIIAAPLARVWPVVRNFNGLPQWNPRIEHSEIEDGKAADQVGCVRAFVAHDGAKFRERLLALSDQSCSFSYSILESPLALRSYVACLNYREVVDNDTTFAEWSVRFECDDRFLEDSTSIIRDGIMKPGFAALQRSFDPPG